jgi:prepilin-type N-terminal cleavage/methylation domain-containing protein
MTRRSDAGFTLPELLVAITILGIIMIAIGAMITTSFHTSRTVGEELQGSRAPKMVSRYWVPDAEQATGFPPGGGCGSGKTVATFTSPVYASAFDDATPAPSTPRTIDWTIVHQNGRYQLVRTVCDGTAATGTSTVIVSELAVPLDATTASSPVPGRYVLTVTVPDRSERSDGTYRFDIEGSSQITTTTSAP